MIAVWIVAVVQEGVGNELLGDRNWYLRRWLAWLPDAHVEGSPARAVAAG